ncbi:hypothetical protein HAX54_037518 [Datura stramonium]|uniref:Uncharacterized protein n=1 Tax=Datura stramonium TaxID=4076 RepID=A0ABS8SI33_DATST|nr:hypothetical protein [Datura stramonium]
MEETRVEDIDDEEENLPKSVIVDKPIVINVDPDETEKHPIVAKEGACEKEKEKETPKSSARLRSSKSHNSRVKCNRRMPNRSHASENTVALQIKVKEKKKGPAEEEAEFGSDPELEEALRKENEDEDRRVELLRKRGKDALRFNVFPILKE